MTAAAPPRAGLGGRGKERVEAGQFRAAPGESHHRRRELGRNRHPRQGPRRPGRRRRRIERRVLPEDGRFQVPQLPAGINPQLPDERAAQPVECGQRIGLTATAIERQHEVGPDVLIQRIIGHHPLQLRHQGDMLSGGEPGSEPGPLHLYVQEIQTFRLLLQPGQAGEVSQRPPAPERQRGLEAQRVAERIV